MCPLFRGSPVLVLLGVAYPDNQGPDSRQLHHVFRDPHPRCCKGDPVAVAPGVGGDIVRHAREVVNEDISSSSLGSCQVVPGHSLKHTNTRLVV